MIRFPTVFTPNGTQLATAPLSPPILYHNELFFYLLGHLPKINANSAFLPMSDCIFPSSRCPCSPNGTQSHTALAPLSPVSNQLLLCLPPA